MWGTFLSEPLDIVAMVGRYPTIKLMSREPIPVRVAALNQEGCPPRCYGVLVAVSSGYPPDRARLLTRYAPLRRSPSDGIATVLLPSMMPLDLHVLSLPLAFILSQDQTLHCIFLYLFSRSGL